MTMKMTLIDKDKFIQDVISRKYSQASMRLIREQPEVKAIPIEWLQEHYLHGMCRAGCVPRYQTVKEIIEDWEKENDRN